MDKVEKSIRISGLVATTAMAGALLSGCATGQAPRAEVTASHAVAAMAEGQHDRAVRLAEQSVQTDPRNATYRAMLGNAYLDAGRFAAAQTSFDDAMVLGDNSPRTALSLALALTAQAKYDQASALLDQWEGRIATADLGLAMALAGQPERGIHLLSNGIRGGENTVKMRQNLAYAYASAGRWREARLMAAQDVPADLVGDRMAQWAEMASPLAYQHRVANLLGVPAGVQDSGQPAQLALNNYPDVPQLAAEATALAVANVPASQPVPVAAPQMATAQTVSFPVTARELPAVGRPQIAQAAHSAAQAESTEASTSFAQAFAAAQAAAEPMPVRQDAQRFASQPAVEAPSPRYANAVQPRVAGNAAQRSNPAPTVMANGAEPAAVVASAVAVPPARSSAPRAFRSSAVLSASATTNNADGTHLVQLGSFSSEQGARRAWTIYTRRYPELAGHEMVITEAVVRGKPYFRVSAGGYNRMASTSMCSMVNSSNGDGCISWAAASPLPGAVDTGVRFASR